MRGALGGAAPGGGAERRRGRRVPLPAAASPALAGRVTVPPRRAGGSALKGSGWGGRRLGARWAPAGAWPTAGPRPRCFP